MRELSCGVRELWYGERGCGELRCGSCGSCGAGQLRCVGAVMWGSCGVWELQCVRAVVCWSNNVWELQCAGVSVQKSQETGVRVLQHADVVQRGNRNVWELQCIVLQELQCIGVAMCGSSNVGQSHCGKL